MLKSSSIRANHRIIASSPSCDDDRHDRTRQKYDSAPIKLHTKNGESRPVATSGQRLTTQQQEGVQQHSRDSSRTFLQPASRKECLRQQASSSSPPLFFSSSRLQFSFSSFFLTSPPSFSSKSSLLFSSKIPFWVSSSHDWLAKVRVESVLI